MIKTRQDLIEYLKADMRANVIKGSKDKFLNLNWRYINALRHSEYYKNRNKGKKNILYMMAYMFWGFKKYRLSIKTGYSIPCNVCGKGLSLAHIGPIIINGGARIGENCRIHVGVNIGTKAGETDSAPHIGNNVYIGPGAKLFGKIEIADGIAIGANAVVNKSCLEENVALAGVPAKIINHKGSVGLI